MKKNGLIRMAGITGIVLAGIAMLTTPSPAVLREVPAGQSPLPPAAGSTLAKAEEIVEVFSKDRETAAFQYSGKTLRLQGQVKGFDADSALNHDGDFFTLLTPEGAPCQILVRFTREQLKAFCLPADKKPKIDDVRYAGFTRTLNQSHTVAYFNKDLGCIALYDSETLTPPGQTATVAPRAVPPGGIKEIFVPFTADKIPLVSVGDSFDADVEFEQIAGENLLVFKSRATPPTEDFLHQASLR